MKFTTTGKPRLLMNFKDSKRTVLERRPSTNFARKFAKVYKEVNASGAPQNKPAAVSLYQSMPNVEAATVGTQSISTALGLMRAVR